MAAPTLAILMKNRLLPKNFIWGSPFPHSKNAILQAYLELKS
jgi:hypothetical protein